MQYKRLATKSASEEAIHEERVPKGYVPILVGKDEIMERFHVHVKLFSDPCIVVLLDMAADELGYKQEGVLRIPCDTDHFRRVIGTVLSKEEVTSFTVPT